MKRVLWALVLFNAVRLALSLTFELAPQEAYYYFYSQHLALSYFDHPPAIALFLRLFTEVLGKRAIALRLTAFTLTCLTQWSFLCLAGRFVPAARRDRAVLLFASTGMVTVLSLISLPDVPLLLFWTLSLQALAWAIFDERRAGWLLAGLCMGLAFDSKYTGLLLQLGLALYLVVSPRHRKLLRSVWPYLSIAIAQLVMLPVYLWNVQHRFASFLFQSRERASGGFHPGLRHAAALLGTQAAVFGPLLFVALTALLAVHLGRARWRNSRQAFLLAFTVPLFALCLALSIGTLVKPNWLMPAYVGGTLLIAAAPWRRLIGASLALAAVLHVLALVEVVFYPVPIKSDDTWVGWSKLAEQVDAYGDRYPSAFLFSADGYKTTAELLFYQSRKVYGPNVIGEPGLQFAYVDPAAQLDSLRGRDALFVDSDPRDTPCAIQSQALAHFGRCDALEPLLIPVRGGGTRKFCIAHCLGYLGPNPGR